MDNSCITETLYDMYFEPEIATGNDASISSSSIIDDNTTEIGINNDHNININNCNIIEEDIIEDKLILTDEYTDDYIIDPSLDENSKMLHKKLRKTKLYKITNADESHNCYHYRDGLNTLHTDFNSNPKCGPGGLYFAEEGYILDFLTFGVHVREVFLCPDSKIVHVPKGVISQFEKYKTNKIILGKKTPINTKFIFEQEKIYKEKTGDDFENTHNIIFDVLHQIDILKCEILPPDIVHDTLNMLISHMMSNLYYVKLVDDTHPRKNLIYSSLADKLSLYNWRNNYDINNKVTILLRYLANPSYDVELKFVKLNPINIKYAKHITNEMISEGLKLNAKILKIIGDVDDEHKYDLIHKNKEVYSASYLLRMNDELQDIIMDISPLNILLIPNPNKITLQKAKNDKNANIYFNMYEGLCDYTVTQYNGKIKEVPDILMKKLCCTNIELAYNFLEKLDEYGGFISGSFITSITDSKNFKCSDIDIYFNNDDDAYNFSEYIKKLGYLRTNVMPYNAYSVMGTHIDKIYIHKKIGSIEALPIQLICIKKNINVIDYIMTYFDINYCKIALDGKLNLYETNENKDEISKNVFNILELFQINVEHYKSATKKNKLYLAHLSKSMSYYVTKVVKRILKYLNRGVDIVNFDSNFQKLIKRVNESIGLAIDMQI